METALPSPKGLKKKKQGISKNPYSTRGLDKFSAVLSDLEARKAKIMATAGNQGASLVRFMYSDSHDWIPVVVKLRDSSQGDTTSQSSSKPKILLALPPPTNWNSEGSVDAKAESEIKDEGKRARGGWIRRWRPSYYWPAVMVLILLCLVMSGRVFAICCTSMWWYLVPVMKGEIATGDCRKSKNPRMKKRGSDKEPGDRKR